MSACKELGSKQPVGKVKLGISMSAQQPYQRTQMQNFRSESTIILTSTVQSGFVFLASDGHNENDFQLKVGADGRGWVQRLMVVESSADGT